MQRAARDGKPIRYKNLYIYPLTVNDYELFIECESALMLRLSTLPAVYAIKSYPEALFEIAFNGEDVVSNGDVVARPDYWLRFLMLLCASLHIPIQLLRSSIGFNVDSKNKKRLVSITVKQIAENEEVVTQLSVSDLNALRQMIVVMNGKELPDESENAELVQAQEDILSSAGSKLNFSIDSLLASVARDQRIRMHELGEWTIYEFELVRSAIERERRFMVCGIGEHSGMVKFPKGNPFPSIFFDRPADISAVISAAEFTQRISGAVQETSSLPDLPVITK